MSWSTELQNACYILWDLSQRNGLPSPSTSQKQQPRLDHKRTRKEPPQPQPLTQEVVWEAKNIILISVPYITRLSEGV